MKKSFIKYNKKADIILLTFIFITVFILFGPLDIEGENWKLPIITFIGLEIGLVLNLKFIELIDKEIDILRG